MKNNSRTSIFRPLALLLLLLGGSQLFAQQNKSPLFRVTGTIQLSHEYYSVSTENYTFDPRRPTNLSRFLFAPTFQIGSFSLPFSVSLSSQGTNTITPPGQFSEAYALFNEIKTFDDFLEYAQNPVNRIGVAPKFKSFQVFLGTHTPTYSELTQGNISIFGAGLEWKPKYFFISANAGISQHAIQSDTTLNVKGAYQRQQYGLRLGIGNASRNFLALNITGGRDEVNSVKSPLATAMPEEGAAISLQYGLRIFNSLTWRAEVATGLFTSDYLADEVDPTLFGLPAFVPLYASSISDNALSSTLEYRQALWGLNAKVLYVGSGYKTFGYPFFQSDRLEWTVSPNANLFKRRVNISASIGSRTNNLSGTRATPMSQLLASANLSAQFNDKLSLSANYSNFGVRNVIDNDTLKVENVAQNISVTPVLVLDGDAATDIFTLMFSMDDFQDYNVVSGALNDNNTLVAGATYNRTFKNYPFSLGANYMLFRLNSTLIKIDNNTLGMTAGYNLFKNTLTTSLGLSYLLNRPETGATYDRQVLFNLQANYQHPKRYFARFQASNNAFAFGSARPGARLTETNFRIAVGKRF